MSEIDKEKLFHISPKKGLVELTPVKPAEDIKNCSLVWDITSDLGGLISGKKLPQSSDCVCFTGNLEMNFHCNPIKKGYIYEPQTKEIPRKIFEELSESGHIKQESEAPDWCDFRETREHRFYKPVPVKMVGEFEMTWNKEKQILEPKIKWYDLEKNDA